MTGRKKRDVAFRQAGRDSRRECDQGDMVEGGERKQEASRMEMEIGIRKRKESEKEREREGQ
jgi:hypothetical protein